MKQDGYDQSQPIEVADANGKLIILDGHHRTQGAIGAGIKKVPINVNKVSKQEADQLLIEAAEAKLY